VKTRWYALLALPLWSPPAFACEESIGRIVSIQVGDVSLQEVPSDRVRLTRKGDVIASIAGEPLCEDDRLSISAEDESIKVMVSLGQAGADESINTLGAGSVAVFRSRTSLELLIGRIFADLRGRFSLVTSFGRLAAEGTAFSVSVGDDGFDLAQIEGEIEVRSEAPAPVHVQPASSYRSGHSAPTPLEDSACSNLLTENGQALIRSLPKTPTDLRQVSESPGHDSEGFPAARSASLCGGDRRGPLGSTFLQLGRLQWAEETLRQQASNLSGAALAANLAELGQLSLRKGRIEEAMTLFARARSIDASSVAALAGTGDAHRDRAISLRRQQLDQKLTELSHAERYYRLAVQQGTSQTHRGSLMVRLGDLALLRTTLETDRSEVLLGRAKRHFQEAVASGAPAHGRLGLARVPWHRGQLIPTQRVTGGDYNFLELVAINTFMAIAANLERRPHREQAREMLAALVEDFPSFSPAREWLGVVEAALGERDEARDQLRRAVAVDPYNVSSYVAYAEAASRQDRDLYRSAYQGMATKESLEILKRSRDMLNESATIDVSAEALTASLPYIKLSLPDNASASVTFSNRQDVPTRVDSVKIREDNASAFEIVRDTCMGRELQSHDECSVTIRFKVDAAGDFSSTLRLEGGGGLWELGVPLSGSYEPHVVQ